MPVGHRLDRRRHVVRAPARRQVGALDRAVLARAARRRQRRVQTVAVRQQRRQNFSR